MNTESGQAVIVLVMVVTIVTIMFTHVALLNMGALANSNELAEALVLRTKAEGYLENAAMRFLRNTDYEDESLNDGTISCTITVTNLGGVNRDFESRCARDGREKAVGMQVTLVNGSFSFSKIEER
jgi:hypothetical protein